MRKVLFIMGAFVLSIPAFAQPGAYEQPPNYNEPGATTGDFFVGAGFGGFTSHLNELSTVGVAWNARLGVNFARYWGADLSYLGTNSAVNTIAQSGGALSGTAFTHQQITADLKFGPPLMLGEHMLRPYAVAGAGYGHIGISTNLAIYHLPSEDVGAFPLGGGISFDITPNFVIDGRYTYNLLTDKVGNAWDVAFNLGAKWGAY